MDLDLDLDESMFAQLLSQEEQGWGSTSHHHHEPSAYDIIHHLFDHVKHLKMGQEYLMKQVRWLDYRIKKNMIELKKLEPVNPLKNFMGVNKLELQAKQNVPKVLKTITVLPGETIDINVALSVKVGFLGCTLQILSDDVVKAEGVA